MKNLYRLGIVCLVLFIITACGNDAINDQNAANQHDAAGNNEVGESVDEAIAKQANTVFKNRCIQCHGTELQGLMGDRSNLQAVGARLSREEIETTIRQGVDRMGMPAFEKSLNDDEIAALAEWLSAKK